MGALEILCQRFLFSGRVTVLAALPLIFWIALAFFSGLISRHAFLDYVADMGE